MIVLITSYHRCYTSLVCQWLVRNGADFPGPLMGAGIGNEHGHFENLPLLKLVNAYNNRECDESEALTIFRENFGQFIDSPLIFFLKVRMQFFLYQSYFKQIWWVK